MTALIERIFLEIRTVLGMQKRALIRASKSRRVSYQSFEFGRMQRDFKVPRSTYYENCVFICHKPVGKYLQITFTGRMDGCSLTGIDPSNFIMTEASKMTSMLSEVGEVLSEDQLNQLPALRQWLESKNRINWLAQELHK